MNQAATITSLVSGVYILSSPFFQSKRGLIVDASGSVLVDTSISFAETEMMLDQAEASGQPVRRIVLTHSHFDHSAGCQLLPRAERIAQHGAGEFLLSAHAAEYLARRPPEHPDLARVHITLPTIELEGAATVRLELGMLHLLPTPGHSPDSMCILVEPKGILFTGDTLVTCFPPVIQDGDSTDAVASLKRILALRFEWLVPGHGPVLDASAAREHCQTSLNYLEAMRSRISRFDDPETPFEVISAAVDDLCSVFPFPSDTVQEWHERAVAKVWEEKRHILMDRHMLRLSQ